jgi:hypothetical protein
MDTSDGHLTSIEYAAKEKVRIDRENCFTPVVFTGERLVVSAKNIREGGIGLARLIAENTPNCREQALALTNLEQAIMWANKAIAAEERRALLAPYEKTSVGTTDSHE